MSFLRPILPRLTSAQPLAVASRGSTFTPLPFCASSSSSSSLTAVRCYSTPKAPSAEIATAGIDGADADDSTGRDLPAEQKAREETALQADILSDAPPELHQRSVRIFKPAKTANSSGKAGTNHWRLDWDILQGSARWENPLIGWASSADYMQGTALKFRTKEDAIHFCEKQGWDYLVQEPHYARIGVKTYAANYQHSPGKLRIHHTK